MFTNPSQNRLQAKAPSAGYHLSVVGEPVPGDETLLTPEALDLIRAVHRKFGRQRLALLDAHFRRRTATDVHHDHPTTPGAPGLERRVVGLTGALHETSSVDALDPTADVWIADFAHLTSPTWTNTIKSHLQLRSAIAGHAPGTRADGGPTVALRPRCLPLLEHHIRVDCEPVPAGFVDVALHCFHNAVALLRTGRGPHFYLPQLGSQSEARLWNDVFDFTERALGLPSDAIRVTVLIDKSAPCRI
ncbi:hypothetical protein ACFQ06_02145 [Tessaracoccus lubricantis]